MAWRALADTPHAQRIFLTLGYAAPQVPLPAVVFTLALEMDDLAFMRGDENSYCIEPESFTWLRRNRGKGKKLAQLVEICDQTLENYSWLVKGKVLIKSVSDEKAFFFLSFKSRFCNWK